MLNSKLPKKIKNLCLLLENLSKRDIELLVERFARERSMQEVADNFKITAERVRQLENRLIEKVKEYIGIK